MTAVVTTAIAIDASAALISAACESSLRRVALAVAGHGTKAREITRLIAALEAAEFTKSLRLGVLLESLPEGLNVVKVERMLATSEVRGSLHEIVAAVLLDASPQVSSLVRENFVMQFSAHAATVDCSASALERFAVTVYEELERVISETKAALTKGAPKTLDSLKTHASARLLQATLSSIQSHNDSIKKSAVASIEVAARWQASYLTQVREAHGYIQPPDFERKRKVSYEDLYVAPRIRKYPRSGDRRSLSIKELMNRLDRTVLLGDPGGGKSTASSYIAYQHAISDDGVLPFVVILRDFTEDSNRVKSVVEYIEDRLRWFYQTPSPTGTVDNLFRQGKALVIFDGLDELLDSSFRRQMTEIVELFSRRYPLISILVTSRRVGYEQAQLDQSEFESYQLAGFDSTQVAQYADKWFAQDEGIPEGERPQTVASFVRETQGLPDLTESPLMLSLICILYRGEGFIPRNRPDVYERCASLLFEKWDSSRRIHVELKAKALIDPAMKHLAYSMFTNANAEAVTEPELLRSVEEILEDAFESASDRRVAAREFVEFCRGRAWVLSDAGTTADGVALFKFTHRTFLEYFAAFELSRIANGPESLGKRLLPIISRGQWEVVAQLSVQIENRNSRKGADRVVQQIFKDGRQRTDENRDNILAFCGRVAEVCVLPPKTVRELVRRSIENVVQLEGRRRHIPRAVAQLPNLAAESVPVAQDEMRSLIESKLRSDDSDAQSWASNFLCSDLSVLLQIWANESLDGWIEWIEHQIRDLSQLIMRVDPLTNECLYALLNAGVIDFEDYVARSMASKPDSLPLDPVFQYRRTHLVGIIQPPLAYELLMTIHDDVDRTRHSIASMAFDNDRARQLITELSRYFDKVISLEMSTRRLGISATWWSPALLEASITKAMLEKDTDIAWGLSNIIALGIETVDAAVVVDGSPSSGQRAILDPLILSCEELLNKSAVNNDLRIRRAQDWRKHHNFAGWAEG